MSSHEGRFFSKRASQISTTRYSADVSRWGRAGIPGEELGTETPRGEFPSQRINAQMCLTQWDQEGSWPA